MQIAELRAAYRAMVLSRAIEEFCARTSPHWYSGVGEEAVVVGAWSALGPSDFAAPHYRGALIASWLRGRPLEHVLATVVQRRGSPAGGRMYGPFAGALELRLMPYVTFALGPNLGVAVGAALAFRLRGEPHVAMAGLGDGTAGNGDFHESVNLAATLGVPCVFVCQNNRYSISTATYRTMAAASVSQWVKGYGIPTVEVDGNDVAAVHDAVVAAVDRARAGAGPAFVEAHTYRRTGHFVGDPADYRDPAEVAAWEQHDPIRRLEATLRARGIDGEELRRVERGAKADVEAAAAVAATADPLDASDLGLPEAVTS